MTDAKTTVTVPEPPSAEEVGRALRLMEPIRKVINPKVYGIEHVPRRTYSESSLRSLPGVAGIGVRAWSRSW